ncbi:methyltransferase (plasmid) [Streptomyces sp. BI20]|uniref:methyltransferase n=1 Tax=Streptomyces sp. BI20 TaxID=3403460 RepID=UPI003C787727
MTTPTATPDSLNPPDQVRQDTDRLRAAVSFVRDHDTTTLLGLLLPDLNARELAALADRCRFAHAALLVLPPDELSLRRQLADCGLDPDTGTHPSVVVRDRLARRHGLDADRLDVRILRPRVPGPDGDGDGDDSADAGHRLVEVFSLYAPDGTPLTRIAAEERDAEHEAHVAFEVTAPDPLVLRGLRDLLSRHGAHADGGGHNPHEDGTVFYFTAPAHSKAGYRRIELYAPGDHRDTLAEHLADHRAGQPAETLLRLMTGAWTTQALAACARLRLPEALEAAGAVEAPRHASFPADVATLARDLDVDADNLATLLRYLAMLGVVSREPAGYRLTPLGALLRADSPGSMRALALMYGGAFYQSFALLTEAVRSGRTGFEQLFGENHFDYFARHPELAARFDRSMAASSLMFEPLPAHPAVLAAASGPGRRTVVDVAGGTGELLGRLLAAHPGLDGVLLERGHVVEGARRHLDALGVGARCGYVVGDFAEVPPGGDVYVLSRVLHDWDDARCREILAHCARAMPADADLLIVERLLPADDSPSTATAWDLHMMCNVGGRERTAAHYAELLEHAGLRLVDTAPLPLGGHVLHARASADRRTPHLPTPQTR